MPTVTLPSTVLALPVDDKASRFKLLSVSGVRPGMCLWLDGELCCVTSMLPETWVSVRRGQGGSSARPHVSSVTVYIGSAEQFYASDPVGRPPDPVLVSPWINVVNGKVWYAQGDAEPIGISDRWWQHQTLTRDVGALGVRTTTPFPLSST